MTRNSIFRVEIYYDLPLVAITTSSQHQLRHTHEHQRNNPTPTTRRDNFSTKDRPRHLPCHVEYKFGILIVVFKKCAVCINCNFDWEETNLQIVTLPFVSSLHGTLTVTKNNIFRPFVLALSSQEYSLVIRRAARIDLLCVHDMNRLNCSFTKGHYH